MLTAASPSAQPAIVKIGRVDALIIIIILLPPAATPIAARLYALMAALLLLLVDERADKYTAITPSSPCRRCALATPRRQGMLRHISDHR